MLLAGAAAIVAAAGLAPDGPAIAGGLCGDLETVVIAGVQTCTHGGDEPVPDVVASPGSRSPAARSALPPAPCPGNGRAGHRIRVFLGYPSDTAAPDAAVARPLIKQAVALADQNLDVQSPTTLGQHYRFWCARDQGITITTLQLAAIGGDTAYSFNDVANALDAKGYRDPDFVYVAFVANIDCCYPYGGQGSLAVDDQPDPALNANNGQRPRYSMIRLGPGYAAGSLALAFQHEVGHNLGAVQNSAPHASGGFHCFETYDTMCYDDGGSYFTGGGLLVGSCPDVSATGLYAFDCNGDDYYNVEPAPNGYLSNHWNVADSSWLTPVGISGTLQSPA